MDALVPPSATQPGFVVNDESHGRSYGHYHNNDVVLHEIADGTRAILNDVGNNSRAVLSEVGNASRAGIKETSDASRSILSDICKISHDGIQATIGQGDETRGVVEAGRAGNERNFIASRENADRNFVETRLGIERTSGEVRRDNLVAFADLDKFLCNKFDVAARDSLNGFKDTQILSLSGFKDAQLFAAQNAAKISAELAECCCEVKELVRAEGTSTRELIQSTETQRLRDALAAANQELLTIRIGGVRAA